MIAASAPRTVDFILSHFERVKKSGPEWKAACPSHADNVQSLSIGVSKSTGNFLLKCHAGCQNTDIVAAAGLTMADLMVEPLKDPIPMRTTSRRIVQTYDYTDENGDTIFQVVRYDPKDFRQRTIDPSQPTNFRWNMQGTRRVLFHLPQLLAANPKKPVFLCAGEKDALNVEQLGLIATTNPMGEDKWLPEYNEILRDRDVVVLCDNDVTGIKHGTTVREALNGIAKRVIVIHFDELPEHGDVSDWIALGNGKTDLLDRVKATMETKAVEKPSFPVDVFPPLVREFLLEGAKSTQTPVDMIAVPFLAIVASVIGNTVEIRLNAEWVERANLWCAVIGDPGSGKSPASAYAMGPLHALQSEAFKEYRNLRDFWQDEHATASGKPKKGSPPAPLLENYYTNDATIEGVVKMLGSGPGLLMERDELTGWIESHNAYKKGGDRQAYLSLWSGRPIKKDRAGSDTIYVERPVIPITGGIQPDLLESMSSESGAADGFIDRFLFTWPEPTPNRKWKKKEYNAALQDRVKELLRTIRTDVPLEMRPVVITLSDDAESSYAQWWEENDRIRETETGLVAGFYSKYAGQTGRLALVLHMLNTAGQKVSIVPQETIEDAITLIEYFRSNLNYVLPSFKTAPSTSSASATSRVLRSLTRTPGEWIDRRELRARLGNNIAAKPLEEILSQLETDGVVELRSVKPEGGGRPRQESRSILAETDEWRL